MILQRRKENKTFHIKRKKYNDAYCQYIRLSHYRAVAKFDKNHRCAAQYLLGMSKSATSHNYFYTNMYILPGILCKFQYLRKYFEKCLSFAKVHKIFLHILLFQNILNIFFYFEKKKKIAFF